RRPVSSWSRTRSRSAARGRWHSTHGPTPCSSSRPSSGRRRPRPRSSRFLGRAWSPGVSSISCWARVPEPRAAVSDDLLRSRLELWFTLLDPVDRRTYLANGLRVIALKYRVDAVDLVLDTRPHSPPLGYVL